MSHQTMMGTGFWWIDSGHVAFQKNEVELDE